MIAQTNEDFDGLRAVGRVVALTLRHMMSIVKPGMSTLELDQLGESFLNGLGARSAPRLMYQFPGATCICVNNETAHGIPGKRIIQLGDLINIDVSAEMNGYYGDTGASMMVGTPVEPFTSLLDTGRLALENALKTVRSGSYVNQIGKAIEDTAKRGGYSVIRNLGSHGIGTRLHDEPQFIAGYYDPNDRRILKKNTVITIEPFVSMGAVKARETGDGWTLVTKPHQFTVQFEHTLIVTDDGPLILTVAD